MSKDYYKILGITANASKQDIKKAFRRLAMKYHPDRNKALDAEDKFKVINEAYLVLSNSVKRQEYDHLNNWKNKKNIIRFSDFMNYIPFFNKHYCWFKYRGEYVIFNIFCSKKGNICYVNEQKNAKINFLPINRFQNSSTNHIKNDNYEFILNSYKQNAIYFANEEIKEIFYYFILLISNKN